MKFLVDFKADALDADITAYLQQHGCTVLKEWDNFDKIFLVEAASMPPSTAITDRVTEENHVALKPLLDIDNYVCSHQDPSKPDININVNDSKDWWKNYSKGQPEFSNPTTTIKRLGHGISVYVMDSGIDASHPEFVNADITNIYTVTPGDFSDNKGHGTAIASVIVGATCGVTASKLKVVKIFDPNHTTTEHEFLDAIDAIINDHPVNTFSVLNCSWSIPKNEWVEHKLRILEDAGVFVVAAAGNNGTSIEDVTPASMIDVITVGAYSQDLKPCDFSDYTGGSIISVNGNATNYGELDGWAPGEMIWAAGPNGAYGYVAGTSIAAGITSAIIASNLNCWVEMETQQRILGFESAKLSTAVTGSAAFVFKRVDLLDLSDPKYQNSVNLIATFADRYNHALTQAPDEISVCYTVGRALQGVRVLEPVLTKSVEWIVPLPENFALIPDGRIYGNPSISQGPNPGEPYKTYVSSFNRVNTDDTQEVVTVTIHVLAENLEPSTLPEDDPVAITLLLSPCSGFSVPYCSFNAGGCTNYCGPSQVCCSPSSKSSYLCQCQG